MKCVLLGATQGCGLETLLKLNEEGYICYVMCRTPSAFEATLKERNVDINKTNEEKEKLIIPVEGDALEKVDVGALFNIAGDNIDLVLFSLGTDPIPLPLILIILTHY